MFLLSFSPVSGQYAYVYILRIQAPLALSQHLFRIRFKVMMLDIILAGK